MSQDPVHAQYAWGRWFAEEWGLFVALGIVVGFALWIARQMLIVGIALGCFALVIGCVIGTTRLERWLQARDEGPQ